MGRDYLASNEGSPYELGRNISTTSAQIRVLSIIMEGALPNTAQKEPRVAPPPIESYCVWGSKVMSRVRADPAFTGHYERSSSEYSAEKIKSRADFDGELSHLGLQYPVARPGKSEIYLSL